jgi:hypothetical protein
MLSYFAILTSRLFSPDVVKVRMDRLELTRSHGRLQSDRRKYAKHAIAKITWFSTTRGSLYSRKSNRTSFSV